jgi:coatomer protein complex subunit gamma
MYVTADPETFNEPFDLTKVPVVSRDQADAEERTKKLTAATPTLKAPSAGPKPSKPSAEQSAAAINAAQQKYTEELQRIPEIAAYGNLLKSSASVELTESETEYVVTVIKHIFKEAVVLQFDIKNTLDATVLTDVTVSSVPADEEESGFEEDFIIPAAALKTNEPGVVYSAFKNTSGTFAATTFSNTLKFTSKEIDPTTNEPEESGYEDEYQVEDLDLTGADYVVPAYAGSFDNVWEQSNGEEASETMQLSNMKSIAGKRHHIQSHSLRTTNNPAEAVEQLAKALSLQPLEGTDVPMNTSTHTLKLFGKTVTGGKIAAMIRMAYSAKTGVTVQIKCRSEEEGVAPLVVGSVA